MAQFCDTSPCQSLLNALGVWIYGLRPPQKGYVAFLATKDGRVEAVDITYCPFCGTRFGWTEDDVLERWTLPPKKKETRVSEQLPLAPFRHLFTAASVAL